MRVAQLARAAAVSAETVRHYTDLGLLRPSREPHNGYQNFSADDLQRLRFIARARRLGFSLKDVQLILERTEGGAEHCGEVRDLLGERLLALQAHIEECQRLALVMRSALDDWADKPQCAPDGQALCRLIEDFELPEESRPATPCPAH
ncbi:MerR family transcriptional regulator [Pseudomonas benzenivorans]|uniref:MerR family transcriptional regulator n=1 Tax=Pseudomonas benzenivorans TaxID=556533 RepID=A0ABZ0PZK5_9PSED|nr:MerR family transcriptional regulator [Pseudomonas benzenivorans]WPC06642.1 MerR family transcriptional regulator [Pseudomonas benzenivorans]